MTEIVSTWSFDLDSKLYVKIDSHWFDLTNFKDHPGGSVILQKYHLKDATVAFNEVKGHFDTLVDASLRDYFIKDKILVAYLNSVSSKNS